MANTILITANWHTGALSQQTISRQYDNNRYVVQFIGYPEGDGTEGLDFYLLVWMSTAPGQKPGEITPIQLNSDQWYISNYFTQQVQVIKFQLCVLNEAGTYEAHSPIFSGRIGDSLEHNGTSHDIDVSTLFDAYREYLNELIIGAGAVIIDPAPTQESSNAVSSGGVWEALQNIDVTTDTTLSISGKPADAKAVGDTINNLVSGDEQREITGWVYGKYINVANANIGDTVDITNVSSFYSLKYVVVDCEEGDKFLLNLAGAASARAWTFLTSNNVLISKADASVTLSNEEVIAPENAGKAIFQCIYRPSDTDTTTDNGKAYKIVQGSGDFVRFGVVQDKTEEEKARARGNISSYKEIQAEVSNFIYGEYIDLGTPNIGETVDLDNPIVWFSLKYAIVDCKEGDTFLLNVTGATNGRAYAFLTSDNVLISRADANATLYNEEITAPENAKKLIIQDIYRQSQTDTISTGGTAHKIIPSVGVDFAVAFYSGHLIIE